MYPWGCDHSVKKRYILHYFFLNVYRIRFYFFLFFSPHWATDAFYAVKIYYLGWFDTNHGHQHDTTCLKEHCHCPSEILHNTATEVCKELFAYCYDDSIRSVYGISQHSRRLSYWKCKIWDHSFIFCNFFILVAVESLFHHWAQSRNAFWIGCVCHRESDVLLQIAAI